MDTENPSYYAIIPANVRYDTDLNANAKLMFGEITCLSQKEGFCFASNKYFANLYNVDTSTISRWIKQLENKGYVEVKYEYNGKEIISRCIAIKQHLLQNCNGGIAKMQEGYCKKVKDNNTSINNININNTKKSKVKPQELFAYIREYTSYAPLQVALDKWLGNKLRTSRINLEQFKYQLELLSRFSADNNVKTDKVMASYSRGYQSIVYDNELRENTYGKPECDMVKDNTVEF